MTISRKLTILATPTAGSSKHAYRLGLLRLFVDRWRAMGIEVTLRGSAPFGRVGSEVLFNHLLNTRVRGRLARSLRRHPRAVNGRMLDISKRVVSRNLLEPGEEWEGPAIVKTDANCGGDQSPWRNRWDWWHDRLRPGRARRMEPHEYPIFDSLDDVPPAVWRNPNFVVERFLPEREDGYFCVRECYVLGDRTYAVRMCSRKPVVKGWLSDRIELVEPHPAIHEARERIGCDYGKLDYVVHDGEFHLLDANRTPSMLEGWQGDHDVADHLAPAIEQYF